MLMQADVGKPNSAHVIVLGNEKGGSGKSTTAMHVAVALLQAGQRVATIDLDSRQRSFTHYIDNRRDWAERARVELDLPQHYCVARGAGLRLDEIEAEEFSAFAQAVGEVENTHDFVVVDTPGSDSYLMRLAHSMADTLITPLNDSFLDFDVLGTVDPTTFEVIGVSHYAEMVREARRQRRLVDGGLIDWVVLRNRLSALGSRNKRLVGEGVNGGSIVRSPTPGPVLFVDAWFRDTSGKPIEGAEVDIWQSSPEGFYENQDPAQADMNLRGKFLTDKDGRISFRSVKPAGYPIPIDGPVGELLRAAGRHNMRPSHLHFLVYKPGFKTLISQIYDPEDPHIETDVQFGVTRHLIGQYVRHDGTERAPAPDVTAPWYSLEHSFVMERGTAALPKPPISGKAAGERPQIPHLEPA